MAPLRVIVVAIGSAGDVYPLAALAQQLARRGHDVVLLSGELYEDLARRLALPFEAVRTTPAPGRGRIDPGIALRRLWHRLGQANRIVYEAIVRLQQPGRTVLVGSSFAFGARIAQEKLGLPLATVHVSPAPILSALDPPVFQHFELPAWVPVPLRRGILRGVEGLVVNSIGGKELNAYRASLGLAHRRHVFSDWLHSPDLVLGLFEPWFAPPQRDWPTNTHLVGFPRFDGGQPRDPAVEAFLAAGPPPIVFVTGSSMKEARAFFERAVAVCVMLGKRGVLLTRHAEQVPSDLPPAVLHARHEPLTTLLPRCEALVSHAGIGTLSLALAAGIPQLLMPRVHDQFDNARRTERLGVGRVLSPHAGARRMAAALRLLLSGGATQAACRRWRDALAVPAAQPAAVMERACVLVEGLGARGARSAGP